MLCGILRPPVFGEVLEPAGGCLGVLNYRPPAINAGFMHCTSSNDYHVRFTGVFFVFFPCLIKLCTTLLRERGREPQGGGRGMALRQGVMQRSVLGKARRIAERQYLHYNCCTVCIRRRHHVHDLRHSFSLPLPLSPPHLFVGVGTMCHAEAADCPTGVSKQRRLVHNSLTQKYSYAPARVSTQQLAVL